MPTVLHPLGPRVRKWRERAGLSAHDVAVRAHLSPADLAAFEAGSVGVSAYRFHQLALAIGVDPGLLAGEAPGGDPRRSTARFRGAAENGLASADLRLLSVAAEVGRIGWRLMTWLADPRRDRVVTNPRPVGEAEPPWKEGYRLGDVARAELAPRVGPLPSVQRTLEGLGIHVAFVAFTTPGVEAAAVREPESIGVVLLNTAAERVSRVRSRRAVLAHELCHLLHDATDRHLVTSVTRDADRGVATEQRANAFAPAFLAPRPQLELGSEPLELARDLVERWGFSREGAAWYTRSLLHLRQEDGPALKERLSGTAELPLDEDVRPPPPNGLSALIHGLVGDLAGTAFESGVISEGRAREIRELA